MITIAVILVALGVMGCTSRVPARGWAGVSAINNTLIFTTMTGRIYSVNAADNAILGNPVKLEITSSGGFSCIPSCGTPAATPIAVYASPATGGDLAIFGGFDGRVYAYKMVNNQLGEKYYWRFPTGQSLASIVGGVVVSGDTAFVASIDGTISAIDIAKESEAANSLSIPQDSTILKWSVDLGNKLWATPVVDGDTLYIGCFDKKMYALNTADGSVKWTFEASGAISSAPIIDNNTLYFGGYDRTFYAVSIATHQVVWKFPADATTADAPDNWFWSKALLQNGVIYAPNLDGKVYAIDAASGTLNRAYSFKSDTFTKPAVAASPVLVGDKVVIGVTNLAKNTCKIFALDAAAGATRELASFTEGLNAQLFAFNGKAYLHTTKDNFYSIDPVNGATLKITLTTSTN